MRTLISSLVLLFAAQLAHAAPVGAVHACELDSGLSLNRIELMIPPIKNFARGEISVAYVSTEEPANAPDHLLVFVSDQETGMTKDCFAVSVNSEGRGFASVDMKDLKASYDAKTGLHLTVPVSIYDGENAQPATLKVRVSRLGGKNSVVTE